MDRESFNETWISDPAYHVHLMSQPYYIHTACWSQDRGYAGGTPLSSQAPYETTRPVKIPSPSFVLHIHEYKFPFLLHVFVSLLSLRSCLTVVEAREK